jgi:hypothetical protein
MDQRAVFDQMLDVIENAFEAQQLHGERSGGGPDHYARLEAGRLVLRLISSRR